MQNFNSSIDNYRDEIIETLCNTLKFESVSRSDSSPFPYGEQTHDCLEYVLSLADSFGFRTHNMDNQVGWCEYGDQSEMIAVLAHLDVVPAGNGWDYEPYAGTVVGDRIYGRGTTDDKGSAIAALYALRAIKESSISLNRRVRIIFGCSEETGSNDMAYYVQNGGELPVCGFTPDGDYPLINGEKGIITEVYSCNLNSGIIKEIHGGSAPNMVPDYAFAILNDGTKIEAHGKNAHGSMPWNGKNAIGSILIELNKLELSSDEKKAIDFLATKIGLETMGESLGIFLEDDISGPLSFNLGTISLVNGKLSVCLNYRYPVTFTASDCHEKVINQFTSAGFELTDCNIADKLYIPEESMLVQTLLNIYKEYTGDSSAKPLSIGGGTYAKSIPNTLAFGPLFPNEEVTEHEPNEYILIRHLMDNAKMNAMAIYALANS